MARSFSRRLSFLHDQPRAVAIVERWLAPDGLLGDVTALNDHNRAMFENVAPVLPEAALAALERARVHCPDAAPSIWRRYLSLLRSLAYDAALFERSTRILAQAATQSTDEREAKEASDNFVSLFTLYLSGTHATIEQRFGVIERLLRSGDPKVQALGLAALGEALEATHFIGKYRFEFGARARARDFGYQPQSNADVTRWYGAALTLIERLALVGGVLKPDLRNLVAQNFRGLWTSAGMHDELQRLCRSFAADGFWREGWVACRETMQFDRDRLTPEVISKLSALAADLSPSNLLEQVLAVVLGDRFGGLDLEDRDVDGDVESAMERQEANARRLGTAVAANAEVFAELLPDLLRGGNQAWAFGRGLAAASADPCATWARLVEGLERLAPEQRNVQVIAGLLAELSERDRNLVQDLLDSALDQPALVVFLPVLHSAAGLDERGVERLKRALSARQVPVEKYRNLAYGRTTDHLAGNVLKDLLLLIVDQPEGFDVAVEILFMRLFADTSTRREHEPKLLEAGRELLQRVTFRKHNHRGDHRLAGIVKACLAGPETGPIAAAVAARLRKAVAAYEIYLLDNKDLLKALLERQPTAVLDALFAGEENDRRAGISVFEHSGNHRSNPADAISCEALIAWCEVDREHRYPLAASIITFARRPEPSGSQVWSEQAIALLNSAPNPRAVLAVLIKRFRPMRWSGSRAALMEANARLLDSLESHVSSDLMPVVTEAKAQLAQEVARERQRETEHDRAHDERFEW